MILFLASAVLLVATAYLSSLNLALLRVSESSLERRLAETGGSSASAWLLRRRTQIAQGVALLRTFGRIGFFAVVLAEIVGVGEAVALTPAKLLLSVVAASVPLWLVTSVIATALADHAGVGLVARSVPVLRLVHVLTLPLNWLVRALDEAVKRLTGANMHPAPVEDELLRSIEDTQRQGGLDPEAATLLENVVEFTGTSVSEVMTPRTDIEGLLYTDDLSEIRAAISGGGHSRIPIFRDSLDDIVGILYVKDLMRYLGESAEEFRLQPLLRQPIRVPETKRVAELLKDFQRSEVHLAMVVDEYGGTSGLVTIEDVLEEIVGEIRDEHEPQDEPPMEIRPVGAGAGELDGRFRVDELNAEMGLELPEDEGFDTIAGLLLAHLGRVPAAGETIETGGARFTVLEATPTQIVRVRVQTIDAPVPE